jgi:hypothetical protein
VTFTPKTLGFHTGSFVVSTSLGLQRISVYGTGIGPPALSVSPQSVQLVAGTGQTTSQVITLKNTTTGTLNLSAPRIVGPNSSAFILGQVTCGSGLAAGATCTVEVVYAAGNTGPVSAQLLVTSGTTIQSVGLSGIPTNLFVTYPYPIAFFNSPQSGGPAEIPFTVSSSSGYPITLQAPSISGPNANSFQILSSTCAGGLVLKGTSSCVINVGFNPHSEGSATAVLNIGSSVGTYGQPLDGAAGYSSAQVSPAALNLGIQLLRNGECRTDSEHNKHRLPRRDGS